MSELNHILLATDGSEGALRAAELAGDLARTCGAQISVVTVHNEDALLLPALAEAVLPDSATYTPFPKQKMEKFIEEAADKDVLEPTIAAIGEPPNTVDGTHLWGHAVQEICKFSTDNNVDLIVIGRRGRSPFQELLIGGVSSQVVTHASCAVLVAR